MKQLKLLIKIYKQLRSKNTQFLMTDFIKFKSTRRTVELINKISSDLELSFDKLSRRTKINVDGE